VKSFEIRREDGEYPPVLRHIHESPERLWGEGDVACLSSPTCIAVVGSRECTAYGREVAYDLSVGLARAGAVVVSGLAYGIDTAAHQGALDGGGKTVAVLGCGLDIPYPAGNLDLKRKISESGAVVTEFPAGTRAAAWTFPRRNRIISGISRGVVVVEAGLKSGSLITAELALQQGRDVFAVPGDVRSPLSEGAHRLIQNGAKLVATVKDILEEIGLESLSEFSDVDEVSDQGKILGLLKKGPRHIDELAESLHLPMDRMSEILVEMEIGGKIVALPGSRFERSGTACRSR
jgi:DNA processing protein